MAEKHAQEKVEDAIEGPAVTDRCVACAGPKIECWRAHRRYLLDLLKEHKQCSVGRAPGTQRFLASHWFKLGRFVRRSLEVV